MPYNKVTCKGISKFVDKNLTDEELLSFSSCETKHCEVLGIRRINRKEIEENKTVVYINLPQ